MKILNIDDISYIKDNPDKQKVVVITGVTGQDGSLMVDYLLKNTPHIIFGGARHLSVSNHTNIEHLINEPRFKLINFDLSDESCISQIINKLRPDYFINYAAQSFVKSSWNFPIQTWNVNTTGVIHILEAIRNNCPDCRIYNAGSSEEFGDIKYTPQDELHPLRPRSPYGASKVAARQLVKVYRDSYGLYAIQGWLFNHEGIRRGTDFVTRKITNGVAKINKEIQMGLQPPPLYLGNVNSLRDWSDAEDFVDGVWRMLNQEVYDKDIKKIFYESIPFSKITRAEFVRNIGEYVVSSGETHSIREFVEKAFRVIGVEGTWNGNGLDETFAAVINGKNVCLVRIDPAFYRLAEVDSLMGNSTLITEKLGWVPTSSFDQLVTKMVLNDIALLKKANW